MNVLRSALLFGGTICAAAIVATAQNATVNSIRVGGAGNTLTIATPTGAPMPIVLDFSNIASHINTNLTTDQNIALLARVIDGRIHLGIGPAVAPVTLVQRNNDNRSGSSNDPTDGEVRDVVNGEIRPDDVSNDAARPLTVTMPGSKGIISHVETVDLPVYKEYEQHTVRITVPGALAGAAVMASPQGHLPSGFVVNYATCINDNVVELRVVNLTTDCIDPAPLAFSFAVVNATASRR